MKELKVMKIYKLNIFIIICFTTTLFLLSACTVTEQPLSSDKSIVLPTESDSSMFDNSMIQNSTNDIEQSSSDELIISTTEITSSLGKDVTQCIIKDEVKSFSYSNDINSYHIGEPGVKSEGFMNVEKSPITDKTEAIVLAKQEVNIDYNTICVYYDETCEIWMILFSTENMAGGCQSVYINSDGLTTFIVYGE